LKPSWFDRPIVVTPVREADIEALKHVQRVLHCEPTGLMDEPTKLHVRGFQRMMGLRVHGAIDEKTAEALDEFASPAYWGEEG
jgi:putative peptidoglycan binding protein